MSHWMGRLWGRLRGPPHLVLSLHPEKLLRCPSSSLSYLYYPSSLPFGLWSAASLPPPVSSFGLLSRGPPPQLPIVTAEESQDFFKDWVHQVSLSEPRWRLRARCRLEEQEGMQPASTSSINHGAAGEDQSSEGDQNESHSLVGLGWGGNKEQRPSYCVLRPCFILPTQISSLPTAPESCPGCLVFERGWAVRRSSKEG